MSMSKDDRRILRESKLRNKRRERRVEKFKIKEIFDKIKKGEEIEDL